MVYDIRKAQLEDLENIVELSQVWDSEEDNDEPTSAEKLHDYIIDGMIHLYTEEGESEVVGLIITAENYTDIHVRTLYVHPDYRENGIGSQFMGKFTAMLDKRSMEAFLEVSKTNPAIDLYERFGFEETDQIKTQDDHIAMCRTHSLEPS